MTRHTPLWRRAVGWLTTPLYILNFFSILCLFDLPQRVVGRWSRRMQKHVLDMMNFCLLQNMRILSGAQFTIKPPRALPPDRPVLVISNHQSMYDIPLLMLILRHREVGFVAKTELGKHVPSISYALRTLDSVLINRKDPQQAMPALEAWGRAKNEKKQIACIFPEGTRARDGVMKRFKPSGVLTLIKAMPDAIVQPVVIDGAWEFLRYGFLPVPWGVKISCTFLEPLEASALQRPDAVQLVEDRIRAALSYQPGRTASAEEAAHKIRSGEQTEAPGA